MTTCCSCKVRHLGAWPHSNTQLCRCRCHAAVDMGVRKMWTLDPSRLFRVCIRQLLGSLLTTGCQQQPAGLHPAI